MTSNFKINTTLYFLFLQGFGSDNNAEMPVWIQTLITVSHLFIIFNSSVNFYIYLIKLHIMHNTFRNCCREEIKSLSRAPTTSFIAKKRNQTLQMETTELFGKKDVGELHRQSTKETEIKIDGNLESDLECLEMIQSTL